METREARNFIKADRAALAKAKVEERFLKLIQAVRDAETIPFKIEPIRKFSNKQSHQKFDVSLTLGVLRGALLEIVKAIIEDDDDFILSLHRAVRFKKTEDTKWQLIFKTWANLKKKFGRNPTCTELLGIICAPPIGIRIDKRSLAFICKEIIGLELTHGKSGRPRKPSSESEGTS